MHALTLLLRIELMRGCFLYHVSYNCPLDAATSQVQAHGAPSPQIVAIGCCNHKAVCARCCLRMRLKYSDTNCPLCKQTQPQAGSLTYCHFYHQMDNAACVFVMQAMHGVYAHIVCAQSVMVQLSSVLSAGVRLSMPMHACELQVIMTAWKAEGVPDWEELQGRADTMWQKPSWAKGVLVDNASSVPGSTGLFRAVQVSHHSLKLISYRRMHCLVGRLPRLGDRPDAVVDAQGRTGMVILRAAT